MNNKNDYIFLSRDFIYWEWYQDHIVKDVFIHLLLNAENKVIKWQGIVIEQGQLVTNQQRLANELGYKRRQIATALKKLEKSGEIEIETTNRYTLVTLINYEDYQGGLNE